MTKRTIAVILTAFIILPAVLAGGVVFAPKSSFLSSFSYAKAIEQSLLDISELSSTESDFVLPDGNRYIIKFKQSALEHEKEKALSEKSYVPLDTEGLVFALSLEDEAFITEYSEIIDYAEPDLYRTTLAQVNDPAPMTYYETLGITSVWDTTRGDSDIIVAVLDTGVAREHEDLVGARILAGYDAVARKAGVYTDEAGHGTGVVGIIAATADNALGIAGVAHGVTILPIKVSASGSNIYSSDLARGIRFAADAGAKIINLSIGGYSASVAEQEAINYAKSKGCILISAAGNGGNGEYAGQKSYPASYDGVISVASCNDLGEHSAFSQYNEFVDITAIGEGITMPYLDENGNSVYRTDSGTSFACAIVSGIAALIASDMDDGARIESAEFESLITDVCGKERDDKFGFGVINAAALQSICNLPIITGVANGETYSESVKIGFNRGNATLDGKTIEDGETVVSNGNHTLTVIDGNKTRTVNFRLDYTPISYNYREFASYAYFEFTRGTATLDGFPYKSGERITVSGRHEFALTDGQERVTKTINLRYSVPTVYGIENNQTYTTPIEISIVGDGKATLDGAEVFGEITVAKSGAHTLTVTSGNGANTKEYKFSINFPYGTFSESDYAGGNAIVDEENGYFCRYGDSLVGVRVYDIYTPEKYLHFIPTGRIYSHAMTQQHIILFGDSGVTLLDRKKMLSSQQPVVSTFSTEAVSYYTFAENNVIGFGGGRMYMLDLENGEHSVIADLGYDCEKAFYDEGYFYILSPSTDNSVRVYDIFGNTTRAFDLGYSYSKESVCYGNGYMSVGNKLYNTNDFSYILSFGATRAIKIENDFIYTENRIIDIKTAVEVASLPFSVTDIVSQPQHNYVFGTEPNFAMVSKEAEGYFALGAAARNEKAFSLPEVHTTYRTNLNYNGFGNPISIASGSKDIYFVFSDKFALYGFDLATNSEISPIYLKYKPSKVIYNNGAVLVSFRNEPYIYIAENENVSSGRYINIGAPCASAVLAGRSIFAIIGGLVYKIDTVTQERTPTSLAATDIAINNDIIYILSQGKITAYNTNLLPIDYEIGTVASGSILFGNGLAFGRSVYDLQSGALVAKTDSKIIAFRGNTVVTEKGVFDLVSQSYIGNTGIYLPKFVAISEGNAVIAVGNGFVSINSCAMGDEVVTAPNVSGVEPYGVYPKSVIINYEHGEGFLDGVPVPSGTAVSKIGGHEFMLSLPCGRNVFVPFNIETPLEKIEFLTNKISLSVGQSFTLRVVYLPEGASSIPVSYTCDGSGVEISEDGVITAKAVGKYTITATAKENLIAKVTVRVRDDLIALPTDSSLSIDRNNSLLLGVAPTTTVSALTSGFSVGKNALVYNPSGSLAKKFVATGSKITLLDENGEISDELAAVIVGDLDGDAFISAGDLYVLERVLRGYEYDSATLAAADVDKSGMIDDNDFRALKKMLFGRTDLPLGVAPESAFSKAEIQTLSVIESGNTVEVAICIDGAKNLLGAYGELFYSKNLELIGINTAGWDFDCYNKGSSVAFYAYEDKGLGCETAFITLVSLRFRVNAQPNEEISFSTGEITLTYSEECKKVKPQSVSKAVLPKVYNGFDIKINNAEGFVFSPTKQEYNVYIPHNSALLDISVTHKVNQTVDIPSVVVSNKGDCKISVTFTDENQTSEVYSFNVVRLEAPTIDSNCKLESLEVEGYKLSPNFNPSYFEYTVEVKHGTERINLYCIPQSDTASVVISDTEINGADKDITITIGAPDGETLEYLLHVKLLPAPEPEPEPVLPLEPEQKSDFPYWILIALVLAGLVAVVIVLVIYKKRERADLDLDQQLAQGDEATPSVDDEATPSVDDEATPSVDDKAASSIDTEQKEE